MRTPEKPYTDDDLRRSFAKAHLNQIEAKERRIKDLQKELILEKQKSDDLMKKIELQKMITQEMIDEVRRLRAENKEIREKSQVLSIDSEYIGGNFFRNLS